MMLLLPTFLSLARRMSPGMWTVLPQPFTASAFPLMTGWLHHEKVIAILKGHLYKVWDGMHVCMGSCLTRRGRPL